MPLLTVFEWCLGGLSSCHHRTHSLVLVAAPLASATDHAHPQRPKAEISSSQYGFLVRSDRSLKQTR
ncbi:hypothetical protein OG333_37875 (plasmid) [Streptomyces anulatus]|uniref:hypothetical protein n=1 Tax=Streptomyces anulatus TaxID=1892 RepID=UPI002F90B839|nr:hypothetical protein OG333_37875 [Streptomyces anulatus]